MKEALTGQTILEYPTFYFCPEVAAEKFKLMIAEVGTTEVTDETKQSFSKRDRPNHNKKRGIQELGSSIDVQDGHKKANTAAKKVEFAEEVNGGDENVENEDVSDNEEGEESEGTDSEDEEGYDEFMKALVDLQDADTSVLQQFIKQAEEQLKQ